MALNVEKEYPRKIQLAVKDGFHRLRRYRKARAMFIREYVGQYYASTKGMTGDAPINLIFHTIRTLVPNLVMKNPISRVNTQVVEQKDYAWLLGLALDDIHNKTNFKNILRGGIVNALFAFATFKTGIADSGQVITYGDMNIDPGQVYTDLVDLDDLTIDPACRVLRKAAFTGDRNRVPRQILLDDDGCDHDSVMRLPRSVHPDAKNKVEKLTQSNLSQVEMNELQDHVDVVEVYVPDADAILLIPDPDVAIFDDYIKGESYYGPKEGPYTHLSFTPPVPNNPLPVSEVGMWYDLHLMANKLMVKSMEQADRQKDLAFYDPAAADEAEDIRTAEDGDTIACNPDSVKMQSFGGQNRNNEAMLGQTQIWHNYMSGNPDQMAGVKSDAETATQAKILETNANVIVQDERELIYECGAEISSKEAWFLDTDPLINLPLSKRAPGGGHIQLRLTPEQRYGDFFQLTFKLKARSMSRLEPNVKNELVMKFATQIFPNIMQSAMLAMQIGVEFNTQRCLTSLADQMDIDEEIMDWFNDPEFAKRIKLMAQMGPKNAGKAKGAGNEINQNGSGKMAGPNVEQNQNFQAGVPQPAAR